MPSSGIKTSLLYFYSLRLPIPLIIGSSHAQSLQSCPKSLRSHGLQPARLFCPQDFPGKNTGVGCHFLLQGIFPTQGSSLRLPVPFTEAFKYIKKKKNPVSRATAFLLTNSSLKFFPSLTLITPRLISPPTFFYFTCF